jgi:hypothetical protein
MLPCYVANVINFKNIVKVCMKCFIQMYFLITKKYQSIKFLWKPLINNKKTIYIIILQKSINNMQNK